MAIYPPQLDILKIGSITQKFTRPFRPRFLMEPHGQSRPLHQEPETARRMGRDAFSRSCLRVGPDRHPPMGRLLALRRVQVKSSTCKRNNSYFVNLHGSSHYYTKADFDFIAAYIIALDLWYIIPAEAALRGRDKLCMTPGSPKARYEPYREAWHLLKEKPCATNANAVDLCFRHGCRERMAQDTTPSSPTPTELSSRPASRP